MAKGDPNSCVFCGKEHRLGMPGYEPMCKIGRMAPKPKEEAARKSEPPHVPVEFEPIGDVVPDWAYDLGIRRKRDLDEPVIVKRDRLTVNLKMREFRLRKNCRRAGMDEDQIEGHLVRARAAWAEGRKYKV